MIYNDHAVIEYQPIAPLTERLTWSSAVGVSFAGYESRQSRRCSPRCRITAQYHIEAGDIRTEIFALVNDKKWGTDGIWYCPLWHLGINVDSLTTGSNTVVVTNFLERGFNADGGHLILASAAQYIEAIAIPYTATFDATAGTDGSITFTLAAAIGVTTMIAPLYEANLVGERGFEGEGGDSTLSISYDLVTAPTVHYGSGGVYPFTDIEMLSYPTLGVSDDDSDEEERVQEYATGGRAVIVERELPTTNSRFSGVLWWDGLTDEGVEADLVAFRRFLYRREGRTVSFLRPSFYHDFTVTAVTADYIEIDGNLSDVVTNYITATCPFVSLFDYIYVEKVFSVDTSKTVAGGNRIYVNEDPTTFTNRNLCLMSIDRLAGDEAEIEWIENRTCRVSLQMVSTPVGAVRGLLVQTGSGSGCGVDADGNHITSGVLPDKEIPGLTFGTGINDGLAASPDGSVLFAVGDSGIKLVDITTKTITGPLDPPLKDDNPSHHVTVGARACFALDGLWWAVAVNTEFWNTYEYDGTWRGRAGVVEIPGTDGIVATWANPATNRVYMVDNISSSVIVFQYAAGIFTRLAAETITNIHNPSSGLDIAGRDNVILLSDGFVARGYSTTDANNASTITYSRNTIYDIAFDHSLPGGVGKPTGVALVGGILYAGDASDRKRITATCVTDILGTTNNAIPPKPISATGTVPVPNGHFYLGERQCVLDPSAAAGPTPSTTDLGCGLDASGNTIRPWDEIAKYPINVELNGIAVNKAADGLVLLRDDGYLIPFDTTTNKAGTAKPPQTGAENATGLFRIGDRYYATTNTTWYAYTNSLNPSQTDNIPAPGGIQLRTAWFDPATNRLYGADITNRRTGQADYNTIFVWKHSSSNGFTRAVDEDIEVLYGGDLSYIAAITGRDDLMVIGVIGGSQYERTDPIVLKRITYTDDDIVRYAEAFQYATYVDEFGNSRYGIVPATWFGATSEKGVFTGNKPGPWAMIGNSLYIGFRSESVYDPNTRQYKIDEPHLKEVCDVQLCDDSLAFHSLQPVAEIPPRMYFGMAGDSDSGIITGGCHPLYATLIYNDAYLYTRSGHGVTVAALTVTGDGGSIGTKGHLMMGSATDGMIYSGLARAGSDARGKPLFSGYHSYFRRYTRSGTTLNLTRMSTDYGSLSSETIRKLTTLEVVIAGNGNSGIMISGFADPAPFLSNADDDYSVAFVRYERTGNRVALTELTGNTASIGLRYYNKPIMVGNTTSGLYISPLLVYSGSLRDSLGVIRNPTAFKRYVVSGDTITFTDLDITYNEDTKYRRRHGDHSGESHTTPEAGYLNTHAASAVGDDNSGIITIAAHYPDGSIFGQSALFSPQLHHNRIVRYTRSGSTIMLEDFCPLSLFTHTAGGTAGDANRGVVYGGYFTYYTSLSRHPQNHPGTSFRISYDNHFWYYEYS